MEKEEPWGVCVTESLTCGECQFKSESRKLYDEVTKSEKPGRNAGAPNYRLQVALSHTGIGNTEMSQILNALGLPSPAMSSMQRASNFVGEKLAEHNEDSMRQIVRDLQTMDTIKDLPQPAALNVEMDCRYNNPLYSGVGKTPFQPATQVSLVAIENTTKDKKVIDLVVNKQTL